MEKNKKVGDKIEVTTATEKTEFYDEETIDRKIATLTERLAKWQERKALLK